MISFLVFCSLLIPVNLWAAITPHMHSDVSMRIMHGYGMQMGLTDTENTLTT